MDTALPAESPVPVPPRPRSASSTPREAHLRFPDKQLGFVKQYTVWAPGLHTSEESRWDYRVIIVRASYDAPPGQSEDEIAKQLFPDQAAFKQEENRRWELTANHWDLPIHVVDPSAAE
jgi:hypothetical protein